MRRSDLTLCLITDEVSPSLDEGIAFARAEGIGTIDLRVVDGRNVLALSRDEVAGAARRVRAAGLSVSCICTPLLKWSPPGKTSQDMGDQFGFELGDRAPPWSTRKPSRPRRSSARATCASSAIWPTTAIAWTICVAPIDDLLALAEKFDMKLHVENEGVCNIRGFAEIEALVTAYRHPRLRALPDIANAYRRGQSRRRRPISRGCCPSRTCCTSRTTPMRRGASSRWARAIYPSRTCWRRRCPHTRRR